MAHRRRTVAATAFSLLIGIALATRKPRQPARQRRLFQPAPRIHGRQSPDGEASAPQTRGRPTQQLPRGGAPTPQIRPARQFPHAETPTPQGHPTHKLPHSGAPTPQSHPTHRIPHAEAPIRSTDQPPHAEAPIRPTDQPPHVEAPIRHRHKLPHAEAQIRSTDQLPRAEAPIRPTDQLPHAEAPIRPTDQLPRSEPSAPQVRDQLVRGGERVELPRHDPLGHPGQPPATAQVGQLGPQPPDRDGLDLVARPRHPAPGQLVVRHQPVVVRGQRRAPPRRRPRPSPRPSARSAGASSRPGSRGAPAKSSA